MAVRDDYYAVLGVEPEATREEITRAWRRESFRWHPDRNREDPDAAHERFVVLSQAYLVLSDPEKRAQYDEGAGRNARPEGWRSSGDNGAAARPPTSSAFDDVLREAVRRQTGRERQQTEAAVDPIHAVTKRLVLASLGRPPVTLVLWLAHLAALAVALYAGHALVLTGASFDWSAVGTALLAVPLPAMAAFGCARATWRLFTDRRVVHRCSRVAATVVAAEGG